MKGIALFLALYLFVGGLFPRTDFGQLAKVGNVLEHYRQHQSETGLGLEQLSFTAFLKVHFLSPDEHRRMLGHEHEGLPFQTINNSQTFTVHPQPALQVSSLIPTGGGHQFFYLHSVLGDFASAIFHPPSIG